MSSDKVLTAAPGMTATCLAGTYMSTTQSGACPRPEGSKVTSRERGMARVESGLQSLNRSLADPGDPGVQEASAPGSSA